MSKKILILANNDVGLYKFRRELLEELIANGNEIYASLPDGEFIPKIEEIGCKVFLTDISRRGMNPIEDLKLMMTYIKLIKKISPDIVFTYTIKPNSYGGMACRLTRTPYFVNVTGLGTTMENPGLLQKLVLFLSRLGINGSLCTFFQNATSMDFMKKNKVGGKKMILIPGSGIDIKNHVYHEYPADEGKVDFLCVTRLMKDKGTKEMVECARYIHEKYPDTTTFTVVGTSDDEEYLNMVEKAQNDGVLQYLGLRMDIDELMAKCHCFVNPTYHEGMSNVLLEAGACGRPVVASNVPGCFETFDEGVNGIGCEAKSTQSLIDSVEKFLQLSYEERKQMGINGRKKIEKEFDRNIIIEAYKEELGKL